MAKSSDKKVDHATFEDMVEFAISQVISAFGKGENLRGAMWLVVNSSANWGAENEKRIQDERKKRVSAEKRAAKRRAKTSPITEGRVIKGGRNTTTQIESRPAKTPAPMK
jgi:hypothetical protein